jgi:hypothetical protein
MTRNSNKQIFIVGTGRSGTTILRNILGHHSSIFAFSKELRFISDRNGLLDLIDTLTKDWSPFNASEAICDFRKFVLSYLWREPIYHSALSAFFTRVLGGSGRKYRYVDFSHVIPYHHCVQELDRLIDDITESTMRGQWYGSSSYQLKPDLYITHPMDRAELFSRAGEFTDRLLSQPLSGTSKSQWCDDTPINILNVESIARMLPAAKFIHVYRDPRDVAASYADPSQPWSPNDVLTSAGWIRDILNCWEKEKSSLYADRILEVSYEQMVASQEETLTDICSFLGLAFEEALMDIKLTSASVGRHKDEIGKEQLSQIEDMLSQVMKLYSYSRTG